MAIIRQFGLLLWKNYLQQRRQILVTLVEILLPLLFSGILIALRQRVSITDFPKPTVYKNFSVDQLPDEYRYLHFLKLAYVPRNSSAVHQVAQDVTDRLHLLPMVGFDTEEEFENYVRNNPSSSEVLAAVVFDHPVTNNDEPLPLQVSYRLRFPFTPRNAPTKERSELNPNSDLDWHTFSLFPLFLLPGPREQHDNKGGTPGEELGP